MDGKPALLYLTVIALITFFYTSDDRVSRMKHAVADFVVARIQAPAK